MQLRLTQIQAEIEEIKIETSISYWKKKFMWLLQNKGTYKRQPTSVCFGHPEEMECVKGMK